MLTGDVKELCMGYGQLLPITGLSRFPAASDIRRACDVSLQAEGRIRTSWGMAGAVLRLL
jgi:hypothetical protein